MNKYMNSIKQSTIFLLADFTLAGCCGTKKSNVMPVYEEKITNSNISLYEEFKKEAGDKIFFTFDSFALSKEAKQTLINQA